MRGLLASAGNGIDQMTQKNARKVAARARQTRFGGKYLAHHRQAGEAAADQPPVVEAVIEARVLDEPAYPDGDFADRVRTEPVEVAEMCRWFFCRFEDPAHGVPHDSGEGGYQYVLGGPYDADDELRGAFPDTEDEHLERAVDLIQNYGWEWVEIGLY